MVRGYSRVRFLVSLKVKKFSTNTAGMACIIDRTLSQQGVDNSSRKYCWFNKMIISEGVNQTEVPIPYLLEIPFHLRLNPMEV